MKIAFIEGFSLLTKQQIFDMAAKHVLSNGAPAVSLDNGDYNGCTYGGIGCAASPFIVPEAREIASGSWPNVAYKAHNHHEKEFITAVQRCHDGAAKGAGNALGYKYKPNPDFVSEFKAGMLSLANTYGLSAAVLNKS